MWPLSGRSMVALLGTSETGETMKRAVEPGPGLPEPRLGCSVDGAAGMLLSLVGLTCTLG